MVFVTDAQGRKNNDVYWSAVNVYDIVAPFIPAVPVVGPVATLLSPAVTAVAYHADRVNEDGVDRQIISRQRKRHPRISRWRIEFSAAGRRDDHVLFPRNVIGHGRRAADEW